MNDHLRSFSTRKKIIRANSTYRFPFPYSFHCCDHWFKKRKSKNKLSWADQERVVELNDTTDVILSFSFFYQHDRTAQFSCQLLDLYLSFSRMSVAAAKWTPSKFFGFLLITHSSNAKQKFRTILFVCQVDDTFSLLVFPCCVAAEPTNKKRTCWTPETIWLAKGTDLSRVRNGSTPSDLNRQHSCKAVLPDLKTILMQLGRWLEECLRSLLIELCPSILDQDFQTIKVIVSHCQMEWRITILIASVRISAALE